MWDEKLGREIRVQNWKFIHEDYMINEYNQICTNMIFLII